VSNIQTLVAHWAERQPNVCAVRDAQTRRELTFGQVWQRSGQVADTLLERGVSRGDFVAVAMHRSIEMIVAMLGILRAGAAYLPLDAQAPPERIAMMLGDADVRVVIVDPPTARSAADPLTEWILPAGIDQIAVSTTISRDVGKPRCASLNVSGVDPAYVAYTSGSSGQPKGVVVPHRAVLRLVTEPNYCTISPGVPRRRYRHRPTETTRHRSLFLFGPGAAAGAPKRDFPDATTGRSVRRSTHLLSPRSNPRPASVGRTLSPEVGPSSNTRRTACPR
jgi:non-ribosomal peptide synthetase component F